MKKCRVCKETKSLSYFHKKHDNRDGLSTVCKKCKKDIDAGRNRKNRDIIWKIKEKPCVDCGQTYNPWQMQFDHIGFDKKADVASLMTYKLETILKEIKKCELVCANCHANRSYQRMIEKKNALQLL